VLLLAVACQKLIGSADSSRHRPEHMSYPAGDVTRHPAKLNLVERPRTRRKISRRSDCSQAVNMALNLMAENSLYVLVWRPEQDSNLRPTA
jgi:hypothetical protein